jgi:hypothetical protein
VDEETIGITDEEDTSWMILSPYLIARFMFDVIYINENIFPEVEQLQQNLVVNFNLRMKTSTLEEWRQQFIFIH